MPWYDQQPRLRIMSCIPKNAGPCLNCNACVCSSCSAACPCLLPVGWKLEREDTFMAHEKPLARGQGFAFSACPRQTTPIHCSVEKRPSAHKNVQLSSLYRYSNMSRGGMANGASVAAVDPELANDHCLLGWNNACQTLHFMGCIHAEGCRRSKPMPDKFSVAPQISPEF